VFIIGSTNFIDGVSYHLLDRRSGALVSIGADYPELKNRTQELGRKQVVRFVARDGAEVTGQLTVPGSLRAENLPLVVLRPSDAIGREVWKLQVLTQFLANRGYAVFERTSRGTSAANADAKQDVEETYYNDLVDGTKWLAQKGMVDAKRTCIAGWNAGGHTAYLGAERSADGYRCAISIAGVSDFESNLRIVAVFGPPADGQGPSNSLKSKTESALKNAKQVSVPVLIIHGDLDTSVKVDQSRRMDKALVNAGKDHKYIEIAGADHELSRESDRMTLLTEVEAFLQ
jgi:dipeptidyl aminopeptidase/acylaminoacyl peptidase